MVAPMLDAIFDATFDTTQGAAVQVNLRLSSVAVVEVDLWTTGPEMRHALEVTQ
jgi:hypothetical protein